MCATEDYEQCNATEDREQTKGYCFASKVSAQSRLDDIRGVLRHSLSDQSHIADTNALTFSKLIAGVKQLGRDVQAGASRDFERSTRFWRTLLRSGGSETRPYSMRVQHRFFGFTSVSVDGGDPSENGSSCRSPSSFPKPPPRKHCRNLAHSRYQRSHFLQIDRSGVKELGRGVGQGSSEVRLRSDNLGQAEACTLNEGRGGGQSRFRAQPPRSEYSLQAALFPALDSS